jgi:DNA-binding transcriptional regulator YiaG
VDDTTYTTTDGTTLRGRREAAGVSQEKLARRLLTTRQALRRWESNPALPHIKAARYQAALEALVTEAVSA